jgi:hypothetical protein
MVDLITENRSLASLILPLIFFTMVVNGKKSMTHSLPFQSSRKGEETTQ